MNSLASPLSQDRRVADPWQTHPVVIRDIRREIDSVATYDLAFRDAALQRSFRFAPGQFNMLYLPGHGEIAISISDDPRRTDGMTHTVRTVGNVTRKLSGMSVGQTLGLRGPFGTSWPMTPCVGRDVVIVAGGIGLAPLRPVIYALLNDRCQFGRLNLLYGARSPDTVLYHEEFEDWTSRGLIVHTTVDRSRPGWLGNVGVVTTLMERLRTFDPRNAILLCCGPEVMMRFTILTAISRGLSPRQIWISMERNMQCGVGLCGHCQLGPVFVCKEGPVFRYDQVSSFIDIEAL